MKKIVLFASLIAFFCFSVQMIPPAKKVISLPKEIKKQYAHIPEGKVVINNDTITLVESFFISKTEVSNIQYRIFLNDLKKQGENDKLKIATIDSTQWTRNSSYSQPFVVYYHQHPAYNDYPVVNVSYEGAMLYCEWHGKKLEEQLGNEYSVHCTLPSHGQWIRAARGDNHSYTYSWSWPFLRNNKGQTLCNYNQVGDECISRNSGDNSYEIINTGNRMGVADYLSDNADITAPVLSYYPNAFGIYNLNGNVAEMISSKGIALGGSWRSTGYDVRIESEMEFPGASPEVGFRPVFSLNKK